MVLIALEGVDGCGKSTVINHLRSRFGDDVVWTREPLVRRDDLERMTPRSRLSYFLHDHQAHLEKVIQPALDAGKHVISDRYLSSHIAYQSHDLYFQDLAFYAFGHFANEPSIDKYLGEMQKMYENDRHADFEIYLDLPPAMASARCANKGERLMEKKAYELMWLYGQIFSKKSEGVVKTINASRAVPIVANDIEAVIKECVS